MGHAGGRSRRPSGPAIRRVFFGGDAAFGPKNIIWAVAHGHAAAVSIHRLCEGRDVRDRPPPGVSLVSQKMGIHEWTYDNDISNDARYRVPLRDKAEALSNVRLEVELGFDGAQAFAEAQRCLNCDVADGVQRAAVHRVRRLRRHLPDRLHHLHGRTAPSPNCATGCTAPALQPRPGLYVSDGLPTGRVMVKDEDVCLHCGLCAERCPTGAWDMRKFLIDITQASAAA